MTSFTLWWLPNQGCDRTRVLLNDRYCISDWKQNLNFGSVGLQGLILPPKPLKSPIPGIFSQPSFKDNGIFEVIVSYKWFWLPPTRGWSSVLSAGYTLTLLMLDRVASVQSEPGQQNLLIQQPLGRKRGLRQVSRPWKGRRVILRNGSSIKILMPTYIQIIFYLLPMWNKAVQSNFKTR